MSSFLHSQSYSFLLLLSTLIILFFCILHLAMRHVFKSKKIIRESLILGVIWILSISTALYKSDIISLNQCLNIVIVFTSFLLFYSFNMISISMESPSQMILLGLSLPSSRTVGLNLEQIKSLVPDQLFTQDRLQLLISKGFVEENMGLLKLTAKGKFFLELFLIPRKILKLKGRGG